MPVLPSPLPRRTVLVLLALLTAAAGCGDGADPANPVQRTLGSLSGRVTVEGSPAAGVTVELGGSVDRTAATAADGRYRFDALDDGAYVVGVVPPDPDLVFTPERHTAVVTGGSSETTLDFAGAVRADAVIQVRGTLDGGPFAGLEVTLSGAEARTDTLDTAGEARFESLRRGAYTVAVAGFDPEVVELDPATAEVEVGGATPVEVAFAATTIPTEPDAPTGLSATPAGAGAVALAWSDASDDEDAFEVERRSGAEGAWGALATLPAGRDTLTDTGLPPRATFHYRVRACNEVGCSAFTAAAEVTTADVPPAAPTDLTATAQGTDAVELTWTDASDNESAFHIERSPASTGGAGSEPDASGEVWTEVGTTAADATTFRDEGLEPGTAYRYRVRGCNDVGCSDGSAVANATTEALPPAAPSALSATATGETTIALAWTDNAPDEDEHRVERRRGGGAWAQVAVTPAGQAAWNDAGLVAGTAYDYRVRACGSGGCSAWSNVATATTDAPPPAGPDLTVGAMYVTQRVQRLDGGVPLVADLEGYLRVFVLADAANALRPDVRVRFFHGGGLVHTELLPAPAASTPTAVDDDAWSTSWNVPVPAWVLRPGLSVLADVDPGDAVVEPDESDNTFPASGTPLALDVRDAPTFRVTFVPVRQSANGTVGEVNAGNAEDYLAEARTIFPYATDAATVHAEYVTDAPALPPDESGPWSTVLSEISALRSAEGSSDHYYGVVEVTYGGGFAGFGYVGWPAAVGWDKASSRAGVAAHEWGHNLGRPHSPGCGAGGADVGYPYPDGKTGAWGFDLRSWTPRDPSAHYDFMSYCGPTWISDYVYEDVVDAWIGSPSPMAQRRTATSAPADASGETPDGWAASRAEAAAVPPEPGLLVWGRVEGGVLTLEPAFDVVAPPTLPGGGRYSVEGRSAAGETLFSYAFEPALVADGAGDEAHFAFVLPRSAFDAEALTEVVARGPALAASVQRAAIGPPGVAVPPAGADARVRAVDATRAEITWNAATYPMAMVRDPATGEILSFARGGDARVIPPSAEVEVLFSDGVRVRESIVRRWR